LGGWESLGKRVSVRKNKVLCRIRNRSVAAKIGVGKRNCEFKRDIPSSKLKKAGHSHKNSGRQCSSSETLERGKKRALIGKNDDDLKDAVGESSCLLRLTGGVYEREPTGGDT